MVFPRSIIHLDADAFFASVEQAADARLRGKPIAVGGEKRGIIASASYEARKFGIYTPMPTAAARRLCPKLVLLPGDFEKYELFSRLMFSYAYDFTPDVEIGSIDEGYLDLTGVRKPAVGIAETIRQAIRQALRLSVSEGIAANKLVSQIGSKLQKPASFQVVPPGTEAEFLSPLPNKWLPGVGPRMGGRLNAAGLARIGQIAHTPSELLGLLAGSMAPQLRNFARGIDERPVIPARAPAKSYGEQQTFAADTTDEPFLQATLRRMADRLMSKVRDDHKSIRTVTVKVRYNDMDEQQTSESLPEPTDLETDIYSLTTTLLHKAWQRRVSLRLVSLKLSNIYEGRLWGGLALDTSSRRHDAQERVADAVDVLRQKFGPDALLRGHDFVLRRRHEPPPARTNATPSTYSFSPAPARLRESAGNLTPPTSASYPLAVVERQRVGKYPPRPPEPKTLSRANPSPELRFRVDLQGASFKVHSTHILTRSASRACPIPLNFHSYYSFLNSTLSPRALVDLAVRYDLPAIGLTDTNNLHGAVEFTQTAAQAGIKPIIGTELHWRGKRLCLYVENQTGYRNLCRILNAQGRASSRPPAERNRRRQETVDADTSLYPPVDTNKYIPCEPGLQTSTLFSQTDGLLAVSADPALANFFPGRFYLEITGLDDLEKCRGPLPCVASFPVHYELPSDRWMYNIIQSIRTLTLLRQAHPEKRLDADCHFRTPAETRPLFSAHPELMAHSREIADRCSFALTLGKPQFPGYPTPDHSAPADYLRRLVLEGLRRRYPKAHDRLQQQIEQELAIITEVGYEEYFLVMWDILQECRRHGIEWITRGSAADSLACYCLEISGVCPIRFDLYFRRFLNKDRMALNKLPDIDVDFPHDRKDDVIDLIFKKYGPEHTAVVGGFSTFQSRSAFAEIAKVLGVSEFQVRRMTERLPHFSRASELSEAITTTQECSDLPFEEEPYRTALRLAAFLDGFPRYSKMHPCGLVLSRQPMDEITPCFVSAKGYPTTHFDMDSVEAVGLVKMDILAQGGLAVIRDVKQMLESIESPPVETRANPSVQNLQPVSPASPESAHSPGVISAVPRPTPAFDLAALEPWTDSRVWQLIASGNARAVHHIESPAMISLCKMCHVQDIDTLVAIVSVIRPGAANESKKMEFARRYQGLSPVRYPHPSLENCLRSTYGLVVYEEHILQICESFADLPPGRADVLRRALGKNKTDLIDQIQAEFADCARRRGRTEAEIAEVWNLVAGFSGYAFCKAHSTAYGVEAYQSAWLKLNYPAEFMAAVLTNGKGFYSPLVYVLESHRLGIPLLPPSVNQPGPQFAVTLDPQSASTADPAQKKIRVPVLQLKGLTRRTTDVILREHARSSFDSLADFFQRVQPLPEEMEALIRVGAFDEFQQPRTTQFWQFKSLYANAGASGPATKKIPELNAQSLPTLPWQPYLLPFASLDQFPTVSLSEPDRLQRFRAEEELLGYPVSGHPLELYPQIAWQTYCPIHRLGEHVGEQIVTCGLVIEQRLFHQVTGEPMKFITIADWTGMAETELFARTYKSYGLNTVRYRVLEITATVEPFENSRGFTLRVLRAGKPRTKDHSQ